MITFKNAFMNSWINNSGLGAKSTRGYKWELIFKKRFYSKHKALSFEYKLKKDRKERLKIINDFKKTKSYQKWSFI